MEDNIERSEFDWHSDVADSDNMVAQSYDNTINNNEDDLTERFDEKLPIRNPNKKRQLMISMVVMAIVPILMTLALTAIPSDARISFFALYVAIIIIFDCSLASGYCGQCANRWASGKEIFSYTILTAIASFIPFVLGAIFSNKPNGINIGPAVFLIMGIPVFVIVGIVSVIYLHICRVNMLLEDRRENEEVAIGNKNSNKIIGIISAILFLVGTIAFFASVLIAIYVIYAGIFCYMLASHKGEKKVATGAIVPLVSGAAVTVDLAFRLTIARGGLYSFYYNINSPVGVAMQIVRGIVIAVITLYVLRLSKGAASSRINNISFKALRNIALVTMILAIASVVYLIILTVSH